MATKHKIGAMRFTSGKYRGIPIASAPQWYLNWCLKEWEPGTALYQEIAAVTRGRGCKVPEPDPNAQLERENFIPNLRAQHEHAYLDRELDARIGRE